MTQIKSKLLKTKNTKAPVNFLKNENYDNCKKQGIVYSVTPYHIPSYVLYHLMKILINEHASRQ